MVIACPRLFHVRACLTTPQRRNAPACSALGSGTARFGARRPRRPVGHDAVMRARIIVAHARFTQDTACERSMGDGVQRARALLQATVARCRAFRPRAKCGVRTRARAFMACAMFNRHGRSGSLTTALRLRDRARTRVLSTAAARFAARAPGTPGAYGAVHRAAMLVASAGFCRVRARYAAKARLHRGA